MSRFVFPVAGCLLILTFLAGSQQLVYAQDTCTTVNITYLANEGVLVSSDAADILIDGLHRQYKRAYAVLNDADRLLLETAAAPFDEIDIILVSHVHGDHFSAEAVARHLTANESALLYSSPQVADSVKQHLESPQVRRVDIMGSEAETFEDLGVVIRFLPLPHSSRRFSWIQNLGHLIKIDGMTILHVGDADIDAEIFARYGLLSESIDIAILPYWYLTTADGIELIRDFIQPASVVAVHISPHDSEKVEDEISRKYSGATAFTKMLESSVDLQSDCIN